VSAVCASTWTRMTKAVILDPPTDGFSGRPRSTPAMTSAARPAGEAAARRSPARPARRTTSPRPATAATRCRADIAITEITCHAVAPVRSSRPAERSRRGAMNSPRDPGGEAGRVLAFRMNDKCASGAGRFLERVARALEIPLEEIGRCRSARPTRRRYRASARSSRRARSSPRDEGRRSRTSSAHPRGDRRAASRRSCGRWESSRGRSHGGHAHAGW